MFIQKLILAGFYALQKWNNREQRNTESGDFLEISAHLLAVGSLAGSNRLQAEMGISLLHLLHTAVNKTSWKNKQKGRNRENQKQRDRESSHSKNFPRIYKKWWPNSTAGEIPLAAWFWATGLQANRVIIALAVTFFKGSRKVIFSKLWQENSRHTVIKAHNISAFPFFKPRNEHMTNFRIELNKFYIPPVRVPTAGQLIDFSLYHTKR